MSITKKIDNQLIISVLEKIGSEVKLFIMDDGSLYDLSKYLRHLPNVQILILSNMRYEKLPELEEFSLEHLKTLEMSFCDYRITKLLKAFPENVLKKLSIKGAIHPIENFIMTQRNIKILYITSEDFDLIHLKDLKLEAFDTDVIDSLEEFLKHQPKLREVTLSSLSITDRYFHFVTQLQLVFILKINVESISSGALCEIASLKKLKVLEIINFDKEEYEGHITELSQITNLQVAFLTIQFPYQEIPSSDMVRIGENFKCINSIDITAKNVTDEHIRPFITKVISVTVQNWLDLMHDDFYGGFNHFNMNIQNCNLKVLNIRGMKLQFEDLPRLVQNFPNLIYTALKFDGYVRDEHIEQLVVGMPDLRCIMTSQCCRLTIKIADILKQYGKNFEEIHLLGVEDFNKAQFDEALRSHPRDIIFIQK